MRTCPPTAWEENEASTTVPAAAGRAGRSGTAASAMAAPSTGNASAVRFTPGGYGRRLLQRRLTRPQPALTCCALERDHGRTHEAEAQTDDARRGAPARARALRRGGRRGGVPL